MKLKYCLQGFGVGVLFATILLSISFMLQKDNSSMTDDEVIARAKILGMVMATEQSSETVVVAEKETETTIAPTTKSAEEATKETETTEAPTETVVIEVQTETTSQQSVAETTTEKATEVQVTVAETTVVPETTVNIEIADEDKVIIQVPSGVNSDVIARMLEEAGVVDSAVKLDDYMVELGVSRYVRTGTYVLRKNMTYDEIVDRMCR